MTIERDDKDAGVGDAAAWLEGLAGRDAASPAAREGARVRRALVGPEAHTPPPAEGWAQVLGRAGANTQTLAANERQFRPWQWGLVASLVLASGLLVWHRAPPIDDAQSRGSAAPAAALWVTPTPRASAVALQAELRAIGASVTLTEADEAIRLSVDAPEAVRSAVNAKLSSIETALDARGRVDIVVRSVRGPAP